MGKEEQDVNMEAKRGKPFSAPSTRIINRKSIDGIADSDVEHKATNKMNFFESLDDGATKIFIENLEDSTHIAWKCDDDEKKNDSLSRTTSLVERGREGKFRGRDCLKLRVIIIKSFLERLKENPFKEK